MARSIRGFAQQLSVELRDTAGSQTIWTPQEQYLAVQEAFRKGQGYFPVPDVYYSLVLSTGLKEYVLPSEVKNIRAIDYGVNAVDSSSRNTWYQLMGWRHVPADRTNLLYIQHDFPNLPARVYYEHDLSIPPLEVTSSAAITSTQGWIPVAAYTNNGDFPQAWLPQLPTYIQANGIGGEIMRVEAVTATSFTGVTRGYFGSNPEANSLQWGIGVAQNSLVVLTPYIEYDRADEFIITQAKRELYMYRMNDAEEEAQKNIAMLAAQYGQEAADIKNKYAPSHIPRIATQRFSPRR